MSKGRFSQSLSLYYDVYEMTPYRNKPHLDLPFNKPSPGRH